MDKIWIIPLFLCVFFISNNLIKRLIYKKMFAQSAKEGSSATIEDKEDPRVFWKEEGLRREPENAELELPEKDFFENEKTEFFEDFEKEFSGLSDEEAEKILEEAGLLEKEGESR